MPAEIHVIGLGVAEPAELSEQVLAVLERVDRVIGSPRQLALLPETTAVQTQLPALKDLETLLDAHETVAVLASGDPLHYGIGKWLVRHFDASILHFYPAISSVQAICHELQLPQQDVEVISLHGRPLERLRRYLKANRHFVILTDRNSQPHQLAAECLAAGFGQSVLWVGENLGHRSQRVRRFAVDDAGLETMDFDPLQVSVIKTAGDGGILPEFPGIPDRHFFTGQEPGQGLLSKREVRLNILSWLQPRAGDTAWDIGAGCGGVAVEWAYWNAAGTVYAIEHHAERLHCLEKNRQRFGVTDNLHIVAGRAPEVLAGLPQPERIFIGGSDGCLDGILACAWEKLRSGGCLVASSVTEETKQILLAFMQTAAVKDSESVQISVSRQTLLAQQTLYRPGLPVTLFRMIK